MGKEEEYNKLVKEIYLCRKCPLWKNRTNPVPGEGSLDAEIMFIGEAPGFHEDKQGKPFVGQAGKLLTQLLRDIGLERSDVFITNVVKCRPPDNRDPTREEIEACSAYLDKQIEIIKPKIIVTLGRFSARYLYEKIGRKFTSMTKERGKIIEGKLDCCDVKILTMYHPAAALYNPKLKDVMISDFQKLKEVIRGSNRKPKRTLLDFIGQD